MVRITIQISVLDDLCSYYVDGGGFEHVVGEGLDGMATEQGYYALASYFRFRNGQTSLYDMSDVEIKKAGLVMGDVTGDGEVDANDLTVLSRHVARIEELKDEGLISAADINKDGDVSADDLTLLSRYVARIVSTLGE